MENESNGMYMDQRDRKLSTFVAQSSASLGSAFYPQVHNYGPQLSVCSLSVRSCAGLHFTHAQFILRICCKYTTLMFVPVIV